MSKEKPTMVDTFLKQSGVMKDYFILTKLYTKYQKEKKNIKREPKLKAEILEKELIVEEVLERYYRVYSKVDAEMRKIENDTKQPSEYYTEDDRQSYSNTLKTRLDEVRRIREELKEVVVNGTKT